MRGSVAFILAVAIVLALPAAVRAQPAGGVDIGVTPPGDNPPSGPYGGEVIEVNSGDVETIWFHILDSNESLWHLKNWSVEFIIDPSQPEPPSVGEVLVDHAVPSIEYHGCSWIKLADIKVEGPPCTYFTIPVTIDFGATGGVHTATITKHIIPEPASMLLIGTGAIGFLLRKRR